MNLIIRSFVFTLFLGTTTNLFGQENDRLSEILAKPYSVTEVRQKETKTQVPYTETIQILKYERYGLFGRFCRPVIYEYRIIKYRTVSKTQAYQIVRNLPPLENPRSSRTKLPLKLPGVESLTIKPELVDSEIKKYFFDRNWEVESTDVEADYVRVRLKKGQTIVVVAVDLLANHPRKLALTTQASVNGNGVLSQAQASKTLTELTNTLMKR